MPGAITKRESYDNVPQNVCREVSQKPEPRKGDQKRDGKRRESNFEFPASDQDAEHCERHRRVPRGEREGSRTRLQHRDTGFDSAGSRAGKKKLQKAV